MPSCPSPHLRLPLKPRDHLAHQRDDVFAIGAVRNVVAAPFAFAVAKREDEEDKAGLPVGSAALAVEEFVEQAGDLDHAFGELGFDRRVAEAVLGPQPAIVASGSAHGSISSMTLSRPNRTSRTRCPSALPCASAISLKRIATSSRLCCKFPIM